MDETEAKNVLDAAATEPLPEPVVQESIQDEPPSALPSEGVVGHVRHLIRVTADDLGADFNHVRDMIFKHL